MEAEQPMDRLICGDVGFGKTEVAIRAAFKAATGGSQVAILAPTTVLAEQHARTFRERMSDFPIKVELLTRLRSAAEMRRTITGLAEGSVDIVIGTHRLLSKQVVFKKIGLLVVDEEQRFGVKQARRALRVRPQDLSWSWPQADSLVLTFALPSGAFATSLLREFMDT
jgi:transcription-repair coupling factor (superfamily II helicase)